MVKIYNCHNFKSQSVVPVDGEPVTVFTYQEKVFVATQHCTIEVFTLDKQEQSGSKYIKVNSFYTEAFVLQLLYSALGNIVYLIDQSITTCHRPKRVRCICYSDMYAGVIVFDSKG